MFNKMLINKVNLINNLKQVKIKNQNSKICAMVKANAYGVGDRIVVSILNDYVDFFGVACFFEAQKLKTLAKKPILICGAVEKEEIDIGFSYSCGSLEDVKTFVSANLPIKIHLKVNTGMNRYGFKNFSSFKKALKIINSSKLIIEGVFTHFATTDMFQECQMKKFEKFINLCKLYQENVIVHADNSFVNEKFNHNLEMVRIGFNLFNRNENNFLPVAKIKSKIVEIQDVKKGELVGYNYRFVANKKMKVGIIPIGYADGFDLKYVGINLVLNNKRCKVLNICMDCFMVDITDCSVKKGDEFFILDEINSLKIYADYSNASEYEVMTKFSFLRAEREIV